MSHAPISDASGSLWPNTERLAFQLASRALQNLKQNNHRLPQSSPALIGEANASSSLATPSAAPIRLLISSIARAQAALQLAQTSLELESLEGPQTEAARSDLQVSVYEFEHYRYRWLLDILSVDQVSDDPCFFATKAGANISLLCSPDPPADASYDLVVLAVRRDWGAELTRDLLQTFAASVREGGYFVAVVDHPDDSWVGDHLRESVNGSAAAAAKSVRRFCSESNNNTDGATGYLVQQASLNVRRRDFSCQFAFRHNGKLLHAVTRPGVFAHRKLDLGARRLIDAMQLSAGQKVLDIGCGSGVVGFAAASMFDDIHVTAIDSNTRAIECTRIGAVLNNMESRITALVSSNGSVPDQGSYDIALGNPPYFANFQIAELFLQASHNAIKPGGTIWFVAKQPDWYKLNVPRWFDRVRVSSVGGGYCIANATKLRS